MRFVIGALIITLDLQAASQLKHLLSIVVLLLCVISFHLSIKVGSLCCCVWNGSHKQTYVAYLAVLFFLCTMQQMCEVERRFKGLSRDCFLMSLLSFCDFQTHICL